MPACRSRLYLGAWALHTWLCVREPWKGRSRLSVRWQARNGGEGKLMANPRKRCARARRELSPRSCVERPSPKGVGRNVPRQCADVCWSRISMSRMGLDHAWLCVAMLGRDVWGQVILCAFRPTPRHIQCGADRADDLGPAGVRRIRRRDVAVDVRDLDGQLLEGRERTERRDAAPRGRGGDPAAADPSACREHLPEASAEGRGNNGCRKLPRLRPKLQPERLQTSSYMPWVCLGDRSRTVRRVMVVPTLNCSDPSWAGSTKFGGVSD